MIQLIGVPFDLCGKRTGSRLGPSALRMAGIQEVLERLGQTISDVGDLPALPAEHESPGMKQFGPLTAILTAIQQHVAEALDAGQTPLLLGGDHSMAMGSVSAAIERFGDDLAVLWIDAHVDLNSPGTSPSGNVHGMPIAALMGLPSEAEGLVDAHWTELLRRLGPKRLRSDRISWFGVRDVDDGEACRVREMSGSNIGTMHEIDRFGVAGVVERFDAWMRQTGATKLWISFDVDALDPILAPGTGTAVRGGLSYREGHLVAELLRELLDEEDCPYSLAGLEVVETNPLIDANNETAKVAVEWIGSLFGKTILGGVK